MSYIKKLLIVVLLFIFINIPVKATTIPEYKESFVELRGAWVSTIGNLDIGKQYSIEQYKSQYQNVLDNFEKLNMNAVFFQTRPANDAFYESEINPWSAYLVGPQGEDPGWDPLPWLIEETHKRGMEFHAWLNPYRVTQEVFTANNLSSDAYQAQLSNALGALDDKNFAKKNPDLLVQGDKKILLNPGEPRVRQHIFDTIDELITKYDLDAIHFDDYFYNGVALSQDTKLFLKSTNTTTYDSTKHKDWRREQVNILIQGINQLIDEYNNQNNGSIQFGISPAAGWAPAISSACPAYPNGYGMEDGMAGYPCNGYSSYHDLFADTLKWVKEGWIDYILPQNYFDINRYHEAVSKWWNDQVAGTNVKLYMGLPLYEVESKKYSSLEISNELVLDAKFENISGYVLFSYKNIAKMTSDEIITANADLKKYWTKTPLLPIRVKSGEAEETKVNNLKVSRKNFRISMNFESDSKAIGYLLYRFKLDETPVLTDNNYYDTIYNNGQFITYDDNVLNTDTYKYYLKAVLTNGTISNQVESVAVNDVFINKGPVISKATISNVIFNGGSYVHIIATISEPDGDLLEATIEFASDGDRYRNKEIVTLSNNVLDYEFRIPSALTENAKLKITISDGTDTDEILFKDLIVVENMDKLQMYLHNAIIRIENKIKNIWRK